MIVPLALIRHAPTDWNEAKRLQGRADVPLSARGRDAAAGWELPVEYLKYRWVASPLLRAAETARLLGLDPTPEPALVEMDWGAWEGATFAELTARYGDEIKNRTAQGLDLRPHDGESPREVRERVASWLLNTARMGIPTGAVTHQGVVRAVISLATGWEMVGPPPHDLGWSHLHLFAIEETGKVKIVKLNVALDGS